MDPQIKAAIIQGLLGLLAPVVGALVTNRPHEQAGMVNHAPIRVKRLWLVIAAVVFGTVSGGCGYLAAPKLVSELGRISSPDASQVTDAQQTKRTLDQDVPIAQRILDGDLGPASIGDFKRGDVRGVTKEERFLWLVCDFGKRHYPEPGAGDHCSIERGGTLKIVGFDEARRRALVEYNWAGIDRNTGACYPQTYFFVSVDPAKAP
jgi:hypothetical protein